MKSFFDKTFFEKNRQSLKAVVSSDLIIIGANGLLQRNSDNSYKFRQDSNFWYLTGVDLPGAVLIIDSKGRSKLILAPKSPNDEVFGSPYDIEAIAERSGIQDIQVEDIKNVISAHLKSQSKSISVATVVAPDAYAEHYGMYTNPARSSLEKLIKNKLGLTKLEDIRGELADLRVIKQPQELEAIQKAIDITVDTIQEVKRKLTKYKFEYEIEADIHKGFSARGASGVAFNSIVASGSNTCQLHYINNSEKLSGELLYVDIGAEVENYAADITRTFVIGTPTKRLESIHQAVLDVAGFATKLAKPGNSLRQNEEKITKYMGEKLIDLGLISKNTKEQVRKYFPHGTSHYLGLDVHDVGSYDKPLLPNMVITIEPGIYIPEEGIGVRIEDDVLITEDKAKVLTERLPTWLN